MLLDTNVISEMRKLAKGSADPHVESWAQTTDIEQAFISAITVFELERGVLLVERRDSKQGRALRIWLEKQVKHTFSGRILAADQAVAEITARLHVPDKKATIDSFIAGTALTHGLTLVTRNTADYRQIPGLRLLNPWIDTDTNP